MNIQKHPNVQFRPQFTLIFVRSRQIWIFWNWLFLKYRYFEKWIPLKSFRNENWKNAYYKSPFVWRKSTFLNWKWQFFNIQALIPQSSPHFVFRTNSTSCSLIQPVHYRAIFEPFSTIFLVIFELNRNGSNGFWGWWWKQSLVFNRG